MPPEESSTAKYDRIKRQLQDSILSDYPNPEREGCPGGAIVRSLSQRASDEKVENDIHWHHLTHCSECYREFLDLRRKSKTAADERSTLIWRGAIAVLVLFVGFFVWYSWQAFISRERPENAELAYRKTTIDIPTMTRSETARVNAPISLWRKPTALTINLPVGSKPGDYEFRLLRGNQEILSAQAAASIFNGITAFTLKFDLSNIPSGRYSMSVRQSPWDWTYVPVVVQ